MNAKGNEAGGRISGGNEGAWKRNAALFVGSQTISLFGSSLVQYAVTWYITLQTQSGMLMTISILCGVLPAFVLSPFAGVWADRYDRKALIVLADALIAVATLALAWLFWLGFEDVWLLFLLLAVRAIGTGIHTPAVGAALPQLVPEEALARVNGINGTVQSLVNLIAPMASGALLATVSLETIFLVDVATAAAAIGLLTLFVDLPKHARAAQANSTSYVKDLLEGFAYVRRHAFVRGVLLFLAVTSFLAAPIAFLTPLQVTRSFGAEVWRLTAIEIAFSAGMIAGGAAMAAWGGFRNRAHTFVSACAALGACAIALGIVPAFWTYLAMMALAGVALPLFNTPIIVLLQEKVESDYMGRVFGVVGMITTSMMPLGMLAFGPLSDRVDIEWLLVATGGGLMLLCALTIPYKAFIEGGRPSAVERDERTRPAPPAMHQ